jgi:hypothetical protein
VNLVLWMGSITFSDAPCVSYIIATTIHDYLTTPGKKIDNIVVECLDTPFIVDPEHLINMCCCKNFMGSF